MTLKLRATHLAPPAYAHLKEYVVLSGSWQIGSISEERAGKGWFWVSAHRSIPTRSKCTAATSTSGSSKQRGTSGGVGRPWGSG
jgi:hypothetical protein